MKSRLFLLGTEQIHIFPLYYKTKNLSSFSQILCTEKLQSSTSFRVWSLFMLFRHKYPRGEGSRHSSFLSFFQNIFLSFQDGQCAIPKENPNPIAFTAISFSRNLEGKSNLGEKKNHDFSAVIAVLEIRCRFNFLPGQSHQEWIFFLSFQAEWEGMAHSRTEC